MRVSTAQFYFQSSQQISNQQSNVNEQMSYISSGKRVLTAKDDAVSYGTLTGYKDNLSNIEKYQRNITQAKNRNSLQDTAFANAQSLMQTLKTTFIQANNGTLSDSDLFALGDLVVNAQSQMLDIANTKDDTGGYVFAGYQIDTEPFALQPNNTVIYQGDNGVRQLQIGQNVLVDLNQSGEKAFEKVPNGIGDFSPTYNVNTSGISVNRAVVADPSLYDDITNPPPYNFVFGPTSTDLTVTDALANPVFATGAYVPGQTIAFNGVEVQISGNPLPGDDLDLDVNENISVFETIKSALDWINVGASPADPIQHDVDYGEILNQIDNALNHLTTNQADAGVRLQLIDTQEANHQASTVLLETGRSNIEDLDYAKAISTFEQSQVALQAAQQTFVQIKGLSLFNYI